MAAVTLAEALFPESKVAAATAAAEEAAAVSSAQVSKVNVIYSSDNGAVTGLENIPTFVSWVEHADSLDRKTRVVGWQHGRGITSDDVKEVLRNNEVARRELQLLRNSMNPKPKVVDEADPLDGLPPHWKVFWGGVPHLDAQMAYKERKKQGVDAKALGAGPGTTLCLGPPKHAKAPVAYETPPKLPCTENEIHELEKMVAAKQDQLRKSDGQLASWKQKLSRIRLVADEEEAQSKRLKREVQKASYELGKVEGMMRSQDGYFQFIYADTKLVHQRKSANLQKSNALLKSDIFAMKDEIQEQLREHKECHGLMSQGSLSCQEESASSAEEVMQKRSEITPPTRPLETPLADSLFGDVVAPKDSLFGDFDSDAEHIR